MIKSIKKYSYYFLYYVSSFNLKYLKLTKMELTGFATKLFISRISIARLGARFEQTMKLGGQALFMNNALPLLSIVQAKPGATPVD